ncbi:FGGY-family carbohydrate kinase [Streptomyces sp. M19]
MVAPGTALGRVCAAAAPRPGCPKGDRHGGHDRRVRGPTRRGRHRGRRPQHGAGHDARGQGRERPPGAGQHRDAVRAPLPTGHWLPGGASSTGGRALGAAFPRDGSPTSTRARSATARRCRGLPAGRHRRAVPFTAPEAHGFVLGDPGGETGRYRALLEGVAFVERLALDRLDQLGVPVDGTLTLGGGGAASRVWNGIRADVLGRTARVTEEPGSAFGMALLAAADAFGGDVDAAGRAMVRVRRSTSRARHTGRR